VSVVDAVGWLAALSSASLALPQGLKIAVSRSVAGVSTLTWQTMLIAGLAWTCHGLLTGTPQIIWPNTLLAVTSGWVLWQLCRARRLRPIITFAIPVAVAALAFGADLVLGPVAFAAVAFVPGAVGQTSQLRAILRSADTSGVSMVGLLMNLVNQILWLGYAVPAGEVAVMCVAFPIGVLIAASIASLQYRRTRPAPVPQPAPA
jgi:uncharacterized protein with PQ loop repeat